MQIPQPQPGTRMTYTERSLLRRMRRGRMALIEALLERGVDARQIAELVR